MIIEPHENCGGKLSPMTHVGVSKKTGKKGNLSSHYYLCNKCENVVEIKVIQRTLK